jgi:hypothetical protein
MALLGVFGVALVIAALFLVLTEPDIQTAGARELAARHSDAVAFFTLDYVFVVVYAVAGAHALWRFGETLAMPGGGSARVPSWVAVGVVALAAGGVLDAIENALLLAASSSGDAGPVRIAHLLAIPKWAFGGIGFLVAIRTALAAIQTLRRPRAA